MRNAFYVMLFAFVAFTACNDKDEYHFPEEEYTTKFLSTKHQLVDFQESYLYATPVFGLKMFNITYVSSDRIVKYFPVYDSIVVKLGNVVLKSTLKPVTPDSLSVEILDSLPNEADLKVEVFCKWHYTEYGETKITNGSPVHFNTQKEESVIKYRNKIPINLEFRDVDAQNDYLFCKLVTPSIKSTYKPDSIYRRNSTNYKFQLNCYYKSTNNELLSFDYLFYNQMITIFPASSILANQEHTFLFVAQWYIEIGEGNWKAYNDEPYTFEKTTDANPEPAEIIDESEIISYPMNRQLNFLIDEYNKGYIRPQNEKIKNILLDLRIAAFFEELTTGQTATANMTYNTEMNIFEYDLPKSLLKTRQIYKISLYSNEIKDTVYSYYFQTSYYKTFNDKWNGEKLIGSTDNMKYNISLRFYTPHMNVIIVNEGMDTYESFSYIYKFDKLPLIQFVSDAPKVFQGTAEEYVYNNQIDKISKLGKDSNYSSCYNRPPYNAIFFDYLSSGHTILLDSEHIKDKTIEDEWGGWYLWTYFVFSQAMGECGSAVADLKSNGYNMPSLTTILVDGKKIELPAMKVSYVLPAINKTTTTINGYKIP